MFGKKENKVAIYIDGSNFYNYLKDLKDDNEISFKNGRKFDFNVFVDFLLDGRVLVSKRYYTGIFRNINNDEKGLKLVKGQQKFLADLENKDFTIKRGRIMYDTGKTREKGTDVKIAVDMVVGAVDDLYDVVVIVSSDTDLIPALQYIKHKNKKIEYVGFSHNPSFGMQKNANFSKLLLPSDINKFIR